MPRLILGGVSRIVSQAMSRLTDVQRKSERARDAVNAHARSADEGVGDMESANMDACEGGGVKMVLLER